MPQSGLPMNRKIPQGQGWVIPKGKLFLRGFILVDTPRLCLGMGHFFGAFKNDDKKQVILNIQK
jgi:hypothetical protein